MLQCSLRPKRCHGETSGGLENGISILSDDFVLLRYRTTCSWVSLAIGIWQRLGTGQTTRQHDQTYLMLLQLQLPLPQPHHPAWALLLQSPRTHLHGAELTSPMLAATPRADFSAFHSVCLQEIMCSIALIACRSDFGFEPSQIGQKICGARLQKKGHGQFCTYLFFMIHDCVKDGCIQG